MINRHRSSVMIKNTAVIIGLFCIAQTAYAMHIMEGFLSPMWAITWWIIYLPFIALGLRQMNKIIKDDSDYKVLLALCGAFIFVISALKIPSVTGSCSHPTGVGLGVVIFGPWVMSILGGVVLLFQSLFLAHGGLTTLGANGISMAVAGPFIGYAVWLIAHKIHLRKDVAVFLCAFSADMSTYLMTSIQLGVAFPDAHLGITASILKFMSIFCFTQIPIAIAEGILTVIVYEQIIKFDIASITSKIHGKKPGTSL